MTEHIGRQARRQKIVRGYWIAATAIGFAIGAGHALLEDTAVVLPRGLLTIGGAIIALAAFVGAVVYWRNIDEAAREAHKFAWFWGGSNSILLALPLPFLIGDQRLIALFGQRSPTEWLAIGVVGLIVVQMVGYGLVWAAWWLRQR
ncbi:hypothetical protein [Caulobacter segnis]|uniref:Uncharacterized protein n=1 Tax=Caulobacter segnis TaxID=88688 RepID=A0A2W5V4M1_9CAUL|nr:hypothetical protein [Caulobacter segnis]PZR31666.1 MAG: hypothetical protein DI526_18920 [Caulobacter segnis]